MVLYWIKDIKTKIKLGILRMSRNPKAILSLIELLKDEDYRYGASEALFSKGESSVSPLIRSLKNGGWRSRRMEIDILVRMKELSILPLIEALKDEDSNIRAGALRALGSIRDERAIPSLIEALRDEDSNIRAEAAGILGRVRDERAIPSLIEALRDEDGNVHTEAVRALGSIGDERAILPLIGALKDEDSNVRAVAAWALGRINDERAISPLIEALEDEDGNVRSTTVTALGAIKGSKAVMQLITKILGNMENHYIRSVSEQTLARIGHSALPQLLDALIHNDDDIKLVISRIIEKIRYPEYHEPVIQTSSTRIGSPLSSPSIPYKSSKKRVLPVIDETIKATDSGSFEGYWTERRDKVNCTVFAPEEAKAGDRIMVQVFSHLPRQSKKAESMAKAFNGNVTRRGVTSLSTLISDYAVLSFELIMPGLSIAEPIRDLKWTGEPEAVQFTVYVPDNLSPQNIIGKVLVSQDGIPIGRIDFKLKVVRNTDLANTKVKPTGTGYRYKLAFISYSSKDRLEVLRRVPILTVVGIKYIQDILDLEPGNEWMQKIYSWIDESDVFLLFWSSNAKNSQWVEKEWRHALKSEKSEFIKPVILEGPPIPEPPSELEHIQFSDKTLYILNNWI